MALLQITFPLVEKMKLQQKDPELVKNKKGVEEGRIYTL